MRALDVLDRHEQRLGYFPTIRELQDMLGLSSSSESVYRIRHLEDSGLITKRPKRASMRIAKVTTLGHRRLAEWRAEQGLAPRADGGAP